MVGIFLLGLSKSYGGNDITTFYWLSETAPSQVDQKRIFSPANAVREEVWSFEAATVSMTENVTGKALYTKHLQKKATCFCMWWMLMMSAWKKVQHKKPVKTHSYLKGKIHRWNNRAPLLHGLKHLLASGEIASTDPSEPIKFSLFSPDIFRGWNKRGKTLSNRH